MAHPIENILSTAMENLKAMIDVDTVVGKPVVTADGVTVIPISKVSFGFASGGGEYSAGAADKPCRRVMLDGRPEGGSAAAVCGRRGRGRESESGGVPAGGKRSDPLHPGTERSDSANWGMPAAVHRKEGRGGLLALPFLPFCEDIPRPAS